VIVTSGQRCANLEQAVEIGIGGAHAPGARTPQPAPLRAPPHEQAQAERTLQREGSAVLDVAVGAVPDEHLADVQLGAVEMAVHADAARVDRQAEAARDDAVGLGDGQLAPRAASDQPQEADRKGHSDQQAHEVQQRIHVAATLAPHGLPFPFPFPLPFPSLRDPSPGNAYPP
jgi:hypothetical protein